eukprot:scaffold6072_cov17-Tisochrysis_lutea.AAC.1
MTYPHMHTYWQLDVLSDATVLNYAWLDWQVLGSWMTKIDALLRRLLLLREQAPDEKSLVFSQFPDALKLVRADA